MKQAFQRNFLHHGEQGAACAAYHKGRLVVHLWGGFQNSHLNLPWTQDTLVLVFSASKGMAAAAMTIAHARGLFDLDEPVASYWPEFANFGKSRITVRQLLAHQAGLCALDHKLDHRILADHDRLATLLAAQPPAWPAGSCHGYHTLTLGWYQSELLRRVDPAHRTLGQFFHDEIARPLGIDFSFGRSSDAPTERVAAVAGYGRIAVLAHIHELPPTMVLSALFPFSLVARSVSCLQFRNPAHIGNEHYRRVEIPSANGIGNAVALARVYAALASTSGELGLRDRTRDALLALPQLPTRGTRDRILKLDTRYHLGFSRPSSDMDFGTTEHAFGCPGAGGTFAYADPATDLAFAYVTNVMGFRLFDDRRERAVRHTLHQCIGTA